MPKGIRHDAAKAAAYVALELVVSSPGASEKAMLRKLTEIVLCAFDEAERRLMEVRRFTCIGCFRTLHFREEQEGRRLKCPKCGKTQSAPEREGRN